MRNLKIIIGLDSFSNFGLIWIMSVFVSTSLMKDANLQSFSLAPCCQIYRVTEEAPVAETAVWPINFLIHNFIALKRSPF